MPTTVEIDVSNYLRVECGSLVLMTPPESPLAAVILDRWRAGRLPAFANVLAAHAAQGTATGIGRCHEIVMTFLQDAGDLDLRPTWARTPAGWHTWIEFGDEAFDVVLAESHPVVLVQPADVFRATRGIRS